MVKVEVAKGLVFKVRVAKVHLDVFLMTREYFDFCKEISG